MDITSLVIFGGGFVLGALWVALRANAQRNREKELAEDCFAAVVAAHELGPDIKGYRLADILRDAHMAGTVHAKTRA
jgi:hypothetical protein